MENGINKDFISSPEGKMLLEQEALILEFTELICEIMDEEKVNRAELARRLNTTKSYITQLLDGRYNMTLRKVSDVMHALGHRILLEAESLDSSKASEANSWIPKLRTSERWVQDIRSACKPYASSYANNDDKKRFAS